MSNLKSGPKATKSGKTSSESELEEYSDEESGKSHDTDGENEAANKRKNQISMIIRVFVVLGLGYLAATEFIFKDEPQNEVAATPIKRKSRKRVDKKILESTNIEKKDESKSNESKSEVTSQEMSAPVGTSAEDSKIENNKEEMSLTNKTENPAESQSPVENVNIAEKSAEEKAIDSTPILKSPASESHVGEVKVTKDQTDKSIDNLIDKMNSSETGSPGKSDNSLTNKIDMEEEFVAPPSYEQLGRGLVYNCKEKYWACLDKTAYVTCNKNMKWNKSHSKPAECAVINVYNTDEDCSTVQKYNISTNQPTNFCF